MTQRPPGGAPVFPRATPVQDGCSPTSHCSVPPPTLSERCPTPPLVPAASPGDGLLPTDLLENLAVEDSAQGRAVGRGLLLCSPRPMCLQVPFQDSNLQGQRGRWLGRQKGLLSVTGPREKIPVNQDTKTSSTACKPADT